jgi:hypothetical protein
VGGKPWPTVKVSARLASSRHERRAEMNKTAIALVVAIGAGSASAAFANDMRAHGQDTYLRVAPAPDVRIAPQPRGQVIEEGTVLVPGATYGLSFGEPVNRYDIPNEQKKELDRNSAEFQT